MSLDWENVQKKAFTHWVNSYLRQDGGEVEDLATAFETGVQLVSFVQMLTKKKLKGKIYSKSKLLKIHKIENVNVCLRFIQEEGVKGLTVSAEDFVDGNLKMLLGFCWILLRHYGTNASAGDHSFEEGLLTWLQEQLDDYELDLSNFKTSFNDGKALLALAHKWDPESFDYFDEDLSNSVDNSKKALGLIESNIKVPALLDPHSLAKGETREKQIVLYLSLIQKSFVDEEEKRRLAGEGHAKVLSLREQLTLFNEENATMSESIAVLQEKVDVLTKLLETEQEEKAELKRETDELLAAKESLEIEKKSLVAERDELLNTLKAARRAREQLEEAVESATKRNALGLDTIRKNIIEHVSDLDVWKVFLEQDRDYSHPNFKLTEESEVAEADFADQIGLLNTVIVDENNRLDGLLDGRRKEANSADAIFSDDTTEDNGEKKKKKKRSKK